nr:uncharacterized protein LOC111417989 [Onthophagus taurus]
MSLLSTYILFTSILIHLTSKTNGQHRNLEENDACSLTDGDVGVCKRVDLCASAKQLLLNRRKPNLCGFDTILRLLPIVCCVPGEDLPFDPNFLSFYKHYNFTRPNILYNFNEMNVLS